MPVQRTREEEEKLELEAIQNGTVIMANAEEKMKKIMNRIAQLESKKKETKK